MDDEVNSEASRTVGTRDCNQTLRELDVFLDGELSDEQQGAIRHHLDGCMDCLGAFDFQVNDGAVAARAVVEHVGKRLVLDHRCSILM